MSGAVPKIILGDMSRFKVAVISAGWHKEVCDALITGAKRALLESKVTISPVIFVPGSFKLPLAAQYALDSGADAAVVLGVVVRGETPHFDYVCQGVTQGVIDVQLKFSKPIGYGVLMCDNLDQAIARCGRTGSKEDKGFDSAIAALALLHI